jgi:Mn2+/Fe2+ NRAMP family transporter
VLLGLVVGFSYLSVERIALAVGAFELSFLLLAWMAKPSGEEIRAALRGIPFADPKYLYLMSANLGAVIMPWMVFFQQSSVVEKGLGRRDLADARLDTMVGAALTQVVMAAVLVATAATIGKAYGGAPLDTVEQIAQAMVPFFGETGGRLLFGLGMTGAALVATIVVTLTAARSVAEVLGAEHGLRHRLGEAPVFYGVYAVALGVAALVVLSGVNLVVISVGVQVMNAMLLPIVLGFLFLLARRLPPPYRLQGRPAWVTGIVIAATTVFGVYAGLAGLSG